MTTRALLAAAAMTAMGMAPAFAQNTAPNTKPAPSTPAMPAHPAQPEKKMDGPQGMPTPDKIQEMMEKMGNPGPNHALLNNMVGDWTADCSFWMPPSMAETKSKGTATNTWDLGKRFVRQEFNGTFAMAPGMEVPFHGIGYTGYDNQKQKFVSSWMDTMATGIMYSEGTYDPAAKTFTFSAQCTDPMTNQPGTMKQVVKVQDENTHVFTMFNVTGDGKETKMGEITYHRKGARSMDMTDKPKDTMRPVTPATPAMPASPATPKKPNSPG